MTTDDLPICRPEINARERQVVMAAIHRGLGNILNQQTLENLAYEVLGALRRQSFDDERKGGGR